MPGIESASQRQEKYAGAIANGFQQLALGQYLWVLAKSQELKANG
jgi:hypothetical protein